MAHALERFSLPVSLPVALLGVGAVVLAAAPLQWLAHTWIDPSYQSQGALGFLAAAGLFAWSLTSRQSEAARLDHRLAVGLLAATALVRLAGEALAVNTLGALALVIDVYALALLTGLKSRDRSLSPFWLAVCFAFALPVERIVQRLIGFGLQHLSADGACALLKAGFHDVVCDGVRIVIEGVDVLVDLPCSGARAFLLLMLLHSVCASVIQPGIGRAAAGIAVALASAFLSNVLRISILAIGIAMPDRLFGVDVMRQPWHDIIGLTTLVLGGLPILVWSGRQSPPRRAPAAAARQVPDSLAKDGWWLEPRQPKRISRTVPAFLFAVAALAIVNVPRTAIDVAKRDLVLQLPGQLQGHRAMTVPLLEAERAYFTQYGGAAAKASYGANNLLVVRTSAPLRHLHAPEDCLRGLGFEVAYLGTRYDPVATAAYEATAPDGSRHRIDVSFVADDGTVTANISHAIWHWLQNPKTVWTAIQRIGPADQPDAARRAFDHAVVASFDLSASPLRIADLTGALK